MLRFFKEFSFPGGIGSHCTPETPGSIHEGGELGYVLSHACGAAFDNPDLIVAAVVGDGESETGPLATSWHINKFLNPIRDGAVLPILHLNGYKINNPTIWARVPHEEIEAFFRGTGWTPYFVEGSDPRRCTRRWRRRSRSAWPTSAPPRSRPASVRQAVPPALADDRPPHAQGMDRPGRSRRPQARRELACSPGADGRREERPGPPQATRRVAAQLQAGGAVRRAGPLPAGAEGDRSDRHAAHRRQPARQRRAPEESPPHARLPQVRRQGREAGHGRGRELPAARRVPPRRDEGRTCRTSASSARTRTRRTSSTRSTRCRKKLWLEEYFPEDADGTELAPDGRVIEMLSEHTLEGMLEGYLLTGRHGFFSTYEAFAHVIDSMFNQHAKWLTICNQLSWRARSPSLNLLITSTVWRQDHNGFTHQDPGFLDVVVNKSAEVTRIYLPPDVNSLLSRRRPLPAERGLHQRHRLRQAEPPAVPGHGRRRSPTAPRASASGPRRAPTRAASRTW